MPILALLVAFVCTVVVVAVARRWSMRCEESPTGRHEGCWERYRGGLRLRCWACGKVTSGIAVFHRTK
jgi:hypothetical protein